jgi:chaperone BCS1
MLSEAALNNAPAVADLATLMTWDGAWVFFEDQILNNRLSQAAIIAGIFAAVITWGQSIPKKLWNFLTRITTTTVRFNSDSADYEAVSRFITAEMVWDRYSRNFNFQTEMGFDHEEFREYAKHRGLTAGYGTHLGFFKGWPLLIERSLEESQQTKEFKEHLTVTILGRSRARLEKFGNSISQAAGVSNNEFTKVPVYINDGKHWARNGRLPLRKMSSVITRNYTGEKVVGAIRDFEAKKEEHHRLGLPHHLGIMLHGEPGCGKSSMVHAIAAETERSIFYLNLGSVDSDKELTSLLSGTRDWSKIILAIEDIDAAGVKVNREQAAEKKKKKKSGDEESGPISLSALLNVLDGILCPDGLVVVATTNHHEKLDPALKREGRFDKTFELGRLRHQEFLRMTDLFGLQPEDFDVANDVEMTGSAMRALLMEKIA